MVSVIECCRPYFVGIEFFNHTNSRVIMIIQVKVGGIEFSVFLNYQDKVIALEFSKVLAAFVIIQS